MRRAAISLFAPIVLALCLLAPIYGASASASPVFPVVTGAYAKTPTITFPKVSAPTVLESKVLVQGKGPKVQKGSLLVANYVGQIWRGKVFDSSFSRNELATFPIGLGDVIAGWDKTLVGQRWGTRMLLVIPPVDGYGPSGNTGAGITGTDTLVFVVDVVQSFPKTVTGDLHATGLRTTVGGITVTGALGKQPKVHIASSAPRPTKLTATVIATGHGAKVKPGLVILQYVAVSWTNAVEGSTWSEGFPEGDIVGSSAQKSDLDPLVGVPLGSRVVLQIPKTSSGGPYVLAIDVVAEPTES